MTKKILRLRDRLRLCLLDRQPHRLGDIAGYTYKGMDPAVVVHKYFSRGGKKYAAEKVDLATKMAVGSRSLLRDAITKMEIAGIITVEKNGPVINEDSTIRLSDQGWKEVMERKYMAKNLFQELLRLVNAGDAALRFELVGQQGELQMGNNAFQQNAMLEHYRNGEHATTGSQK